MEQLPGRENTYRIASAGFKGLVNAIDPSLIADEYLCDMENLMVDQGVLHSVAAPTVLTGAGSFNTPIDSIQRTHSGIFISSGSALYKNGIMQSALGGTHATAVSHFAGNNFFAAWEIGIVGDNVVVSDIDANIEIPGSSRTYNTVVGYGDRLYAAVGNYVRFSKAGQSAILPSSWTDEEEFNIVRMISGGVVHFMFPTQMGLLIIMSGVAYLLTDPWTGSMRIYCTAANLPSFVDKNCIPLCDGTAVYYCNGDGMYVLSDGQAQRISGAIWPGKIDSYYVGEYLGRLWFLVSTSEHASDAAHNDIYALEKGTGNWEKYDFGANAAAPAISGILSAIMGGGKCWEQNGEAGLYLGTSTGALYKFIADRDAETVVPWTLTTKAYMFDETILTRPVSLRLDYARSFAGNPFTIETFIDGVSCGVKSYDLQGGDQMHFSEFVLPTHKADGLLGRTVQCKITGASRIEISRISLIAKPRSIGEESRVAPIQ